MIHNSRSQLHSTYSNTHTYTHARIIYLEIKCGEAVAGCVSECKTGLKECVTCLGGDFETCCSCIEKLDAKLPFTCNSTSTPAATLAVFPSPLAFDDECGLVVGVECGEAVAKCVSECKNGTAACVECLAGDYQTCCPCIQKVLPKVALNCDSADPIVVEDETCDLETGLQCAEGVYQCVSQCKQGLEPCAECLAGDFETCCPCIEKAIPKLPFTCS